MDKTYWSNTETLDREEIQSIQLKRLQETVSRAYEKVPMYRSKFDEIGLKPADIQSLKDLRKIPFTVKDDLRDNYPFGMFAVEKKDIVRIHASSGTTGKPTVVGYTKNDLKTWADLVARIVTKAGITSDDIAQVAFGYGLFTGAFGLHYGLEEVGATVVPTSSGNTEKQIMLMKDFGTTALISTPTYALHMAEVAEQMGIDPAKDLNIKFGVFGGEGSTEEMRKELEKKWGMIATENYGMSELIGPGVSGECTHKQGMHIAEDHFIVEVIDPETGEPLKDGEIGELIITPISKEALPILRYKTKDITYLMSDKCSCGRTMARMAKIQGRSDDMLVIRGVNVFPSQIESVLFTFEEIGPHYEIVVKREGYLDKLEISVELVDSKLLNSFASIKNLENRIKHDIHRVLGLHTKIHLVEPKTLKRFTGKAQRVVDLRNKK
ncbi:phenylacetate--CoA ligase family protein [Wukongibacter sp. M2B1]|uniref:phenylacetate--CoA ligase family protein n=1 Tax=Wukongibacter sp. M2B1 TaxID=3088895 RepID=UPI003D7B8E7B